MTGRLSQDEINALLKGNKGLNSLQVPEEDRAGSTQNTETGMEKDNKPLVKKLQFAPLQPQQKETKTVTDLRFFEGIPLFVSCELGTAVVTVRDLLNFEEGSVIKLNKIAGDSSTLLVNEQYLGQAEVVIINERFGIRVTTVGLEEEKTVSDLFKTKKKEIYPENLQAVENKGNSGEEEK
ncbi:MAG: FliM/FliN family flagellar motor switch protein [Dethiobacteria bacterium]